MRTHIHIHVHLSFDDRELDERSPGCTLAVDTSFFVAINHQNETIIIGHVYVIVMWTSPFPISPPPPPPPTGRFKQILKVKNVAVQIPLSLIALLGNS